MVISKAASILRLDVDSEYKDFHFIDVNDENWGERVKHSFSGYVTPAWGGNALRF